MKRFPELIHVVVDGDGDDEYLAVYDNGVFGIDEPGKRVAIYKLVDVGTVAITKKFVSKAIVPRKKR